MNKLVKRKMFVYFMWIYFKVLNWLKNLCFVNFVVDNIGGCEIEIIG